MIIKIKKLSKNAVIPKSAKPGDAGVDLTIAKISEGTLFTIKYDFDIAMEIPNGYYGDVRSRSSVFKTLMVLSNSCGVVDSGYRGNISAVFYKIPFLSKPYKVGERCAQLIITKTNNITFEEVNELGSSDRGEGGYGSTGKSNIL